MILKLIISKKWAHEILFNNKRVEFREYKPFYMRRIGDNNIHTIEFQIGYSVNAIKFTCDCLGIHCDYKNYQIKLGEPRLN